MVDSACLPHSVTAVGLVVQLRFCGTPEKSTVKEQSSAELLSKILESAASLTPELVRLLEEFAQKIKADGGRAEP